MEKLAVAFWNSVIVLLSKLGNHHKKGTLESCNEVIKYLRGTYSKDDIITEMDAETLWFTRPLQMRRTVYVDILWNKLLRCDLFYDKQSWTGYLLKDYMATSNVACVCTGVLGRTILLTIWRIMQRS